MRRYLAVVFLLCVGCARQEPPPVRNCDPPLVLLPPQPDGKGGYCDPTPRYVDPDRAISILSALPTCPGAIRVLPPGQHQQHSRCPPGKEKRGLLPPRP